MDIGQTSIEHKKQLWHFILPSWLELVLYLAISLAALLIGNIGYVKGMLLDYRFAAPTPLNTQPFDPSSNPAFDFGSLVTLAIWGFIGCVAYMLIWGAFNFAGALKNEAEDANGIFPAGYDKKIYWKSRLGLNGLFFFSVVGLLLALVMLVTVIYPLCSSFFAYALSNLNNQVGYIYLAVAVLVFSLGLHILSRIFMCARYSTGLFFSQGK